MTLNTRLGDAAQNAGIDAVLATLGVSGRLRIYSGTQPTEPDTALGAQVLLADLALSATAFASASGGSAVANAITSAIAAATGTATWASFTTSAFVRKIDVSVGTSAANLILNSVAISSGATVSVSAYTFTLPLQGS